LCVMILLRYSLLGSSIPPPELLIMLLSAHIVTSCHCDGTVFVKIIPPSPRLHLSLILVDHKFSKWRPLLWTTGPF
jgi:hypothetical protein